MVVGRKESLARAANLVRAGISVDVVGGRGSGRTAFLKALRTRLVEDGWTVVTVRGIASLRQHPLSSIHLAGIGGAERPSGNLKDTAAALRAQLQQEKSVLFLDDWDDLDESSWGIAESIRRMEGVPVVLSRLQGLRARHTPSGLDASTLEPSYVIDMNPLRFEEMEHALEDYLRAPIEANTMRRIYAKTGGNIGLAVSLLDATTREGQLTLRNGEWIAYRDLWSTGLRAVLEGYLESLDEDTRDALEIIAIAGLVTLETVRKLVDWGTLELLEERAMVAFVENGSSHLVTVTPPLLVEYFRHEPLNARRTRLTELIVDRLGNAESATAILSEHHYRPHTSPEKEALFTRLLHERARALRIVTATAWEASPTPANAVRYVEALSHTFTPNVETTVQRVFADTSASGSSPADCVQFQVLKARWYAYVDQDLTLALDQLRKPEQDLGPHARIFEAAEVEIRFNLDTLPYDYAEKLEITDDLPSDVSKELLETQLFVLVCTGRLTAAEKVYKEIERLGSPTSMARVLQSMMLVGTGRVQLAVESIARGFDEAHSYLDVEGVRNFGAAAIMCRIISGTFEGLDELVDAVFAAGYPTPFPAGNQLALLSTGGLIMIRRGNISMGERFISEAARLNLSDGPLPGQSQAWARAQLLIFNGKAHEAAGLLWETSEQLWSQGGKYAAVTGFLASVEIESSEDRLSLLQDRLAELDSLATFQTQADYYLAVREQSFEGVTKAAADFEETGRFGLAVRAYTQAAELAEKACDIKSKDSSLLKAKELHNLHVELDTARYSSTVSNLTEREREVAELASEGYSNQEIANRLVLSVRTVETHLHRAMRKLHVSSRHAISTVLR